MRQVLVIAERGQGQTVLRLAGDHRGMNLSCVAAETPGGPADVVTVHLSNERVEAFLGDLQSQLPGARLALPPQGVIALAPPPEAAPDQAVYVTQRSPVEVYLSGLQSVGSWSGFLGYAAAAGVVVWIGLYTNTIFLLVAAMLIAPYAGPAMNMALATARGDGWLLARTVLRYFASLAVTMVVAGLLSWLLGQRQATQLMVDNSLIPSIAVLLPLTAGAAGALNLCQSERSSLVSGAATGVLVAASLAPPAGLIGMAAAINRWDMVQGAVFLLLLQLAGINLAGAVVFRLFGLSPRGARYDRGRGWLSWTAWLTTGAAMAGLLAWQFWNLPQMQRSSRQQAAAAVVQDVVRDNPAARLVEANVRFPRPDIPGQETLLVVLYVQRAAPDVIESQIKRQLIEGIRSALRSRGFHATPLVDVTVLEE